MEYSNSSESDWRVDGSALSAISNRAQEILSSKLSMGELEKLKITLLYTPILMGDDLRASYPARTRRSVKDRVIFCSPQLDHKAFVSGDWPTKVEVFFSGLNEAVPLLERFGATQSIIREYLSAISETTEMIKSERYR